MEDQYRSLPHSSANLRVRIEDHPVRQTARLETPNLWDLCLPDSPWLQFLPQVYSQETPSIISDGIDARPVWPQSVDGPTARSPISQSQNPPLTFAPGNVDRSFGNQAGAIPDFHIRSRYNQHITIEDEHTKPTRRQLQERGIVSPSLGGDVRLCCPRDANDFSSNVCPSQLARQQLEELKEARRDPDPRSERNSGNHTKDFRGVHRCSPCKRAYRRPQDLKRHIRDKHESQQKCPFCCARWSRPERIRAHLIKEHEGRLTEDQQQEICSLRGRDDTIRFLEYCGKTTHSGNYTPD